MYFILGRKRELPGLRSMVLVDMHDHDSLRPLVHLAYHRRWYDAVETKYISVDALVSIESSREGDGDMS